MTVEGLVSTPPSTLLRVMNAARITARIEKINEINRKTRGTYPLFKIEYRTFCKVVFLGASIPKLPTVGFLSFEPGSPSIPFSASFASSKGFGFQGPSRLDCSRSISGVMRTWWCVEGIQCRISRNADFECGGVFGRKASFSETTKMSMIDYLVLKLTLLIMGIHFPFSRVLHAVGLFCMVFVFFLLICPACLHVSLLVRFGKGRYWAVSRLSSVGGLTHPPWPRLTPTPTVGRWAG